MKIEELNQMDRGPLIEKLGHCCTSSEWQRIVADKRPFVDSQELIHFQEEAWKSLSKKDWLEAFDGHPKIGDVGSLKKKYSHTKSLAKGEQKGVDSADEEVIQELSTLNQKYLEKFGYIFIVCATGKSASEMLNLLKERMNNTFDTELLIAANEQAKITKIRLEKLL